MTNSIFSDAPESTAPSGPQSRKWLIYLIVAAAGLLFVAVPVLFGPSSRSDTVEEETISPEEIAEREESQLLEQMVLAIDAAQLGVLSDEATTAQELNRWWLEYGPGKEGEETGKSHRESLTALLGEDAAELALDDSFSRRDVAHLATARTLRLAGMTITTELETDPEKAMAAFYFITRNIQLSFDPSSLPATFPHQALLWGRGRGEDRTWAFVELLRQVRIESYVVVPSVGDAGRPLVAVVLEAGVLLFDPILGLPIPSLSAPPDESVLPQVAATFTEALENDAVFRQLDAPDAPYPWTSEALQSVKLLVVGSDSTFSPRMEALQQDLNSPSGFIVFDGWAASEFREPLQTRLADLVARLADVEIETGVWAFPLSQAATYDLENGLNGTLLVERINQMQAPTVRTIVVTQVDGQDVLTESHDPAQQSLQMVRAMQIQASFGDAMRGYLPIRSSYLQNPRSENREAAEVAEFWTAICQLEAGRSDLSITGFRNYLRKYAGGRFAVSAHYWMAVSLAMNGDIAAALDTLQSPALDTFPPGHLKYLTERWSRLQPVAPADEEEEDATPPEATESADET